MVTTAFGLVLTSCGDGDVEADASSSASPTPTSTVNVPEGVALTEGGDELDFGTSATVVFEPNQQRGTVLELTVEKVQQGSIKDFSGFIVNSTIKSATPYYVDVAVENLGQGDVGEFGVPLYGVDDRNVLLQPSTFTTSFAKCASQPLPNKFEGGDKFDSCLVYLAPKHGSLESVSFRPTQDFDPIVWTGKFAKPKTDKPAKSEKKKKSGKKQR